MTNDGIVLYLIWLCACSLFFNSGKLWRRISSSAVDW